MDTPARRIVFIAGYGRNGGTLVDRLLGAYPDSISLGELRFVWLKGLVRNELCSCGTAFKECPFWSEVFDRAYGGFTGVDPNAVIKLYRSVDRSRYVPFLSMGIQSPSFQQRLQELCAILEPLYQAVADLSGASVLVDSSKFAGYGWVLNGFSSFDVDVVHLVRDPRATAYSWSKQIQKPEVVSARALMPQASVLSSAVQWMYRNAAAETLARPSRSFVRVRYEDLMRAPEREITALREALGLAVTSSPFTSVDEAVLSAGHTQSGNPARFHTGGVTIRLDDEWKREMPTVERRLVSLLTAPMRKRYGY